MYFYVNYRYPVLHFPCNQLLIHRMQSAVNSWNFIHEICWTVYFSPACDFCSQARFEVLTSISISFSFWTFLSPDRKVGGYCGEPGIHPLSVRKHFCVRSITWNILMILQSYVEQVIRCVAYKNESSCFITV